MTRVMRNGLLLLCAMAALLMGGAALAEAPDVPVRAVRFTKTVLNLKLGNTYDFNRILSVLPANATDRGVKWAVSSDKMATVTDDGLVTILRGGTFRVGATSLSNPSKKAVCTVKVSYVKAKSVQLSATNVAADAGDTCQVTAKVSPSNATYKALAWASSDESVATVDDQGKITAKGPGVATIAAKNAEGVGAKLKFRVRGGDMVTIKLSAIGDVVLGGDKRRVAKADDPIGDGQTSYSRFKALYDKHGPGYFMDKVASVLQSDSLTIANVESNLTNATSHASKSVVLSGPPKYREVLSLGGVDIASIANNHAYDFGTGGHNDTVSNLRAAGLKVVGQGAGNMATATIDGVRLGFASFQTPANRAEVQRAIRTLKVTGKCKIVVASFHWAQSPEWTSNVYASERGLARFAISCGADLVLGHHKHLISGIERYKGKMIAYDLGNFISLIRHKTESGAYVPKDSMIYQQRFHIFQDGYVEVAAPNIIPAMNSDSLEAFTGRAHLATGSDASRILELIRAKTPSASKDLVRTISGY